MTYHELYEGTSRTAQAKPIFSASYDVVVAGLGTSGAFAAIAAAQEGAAVFGVERQSGAGGMCTMGSVNGYYYGQKGGMFEAVDAECSALSGTVFRPFGTFHPDAKKYAMEKRLQQAGVTATYDTAVLGVYADEKTIVGLRILGPQGIRDIGCRVLIDATSDGHLIRMCGIHTTTGRPGDGHMQPFTSVRVFLRPDGTLGRTNGDSGFVNQYDCEVLSQAISDAHARHCVAVNLPEECFLYVSPQIGVREGLRFEGEKTLQLEDVLDLREYDDTICYAYSDIDKHGEDFAVDAPTYRDWRFVANLSTLTLKVAVPLGALTPKGWTGLLSCGRCLSSDAYVAASAVRMNRDMHRLGEACGVVAARLLQPDPLDFASLRQALCARGCYDDASRGSLGFNAPQVDGFRPVHWLTEPEDLRQALSTDCPGVAIWSCRRLGAEVIGDALVSMMEEGNEMLRYNAAIALGITRDQRALPVLREIVRARRAFFFMDCRRTNQLRSAIAIFLCGELDDAQIVPELLEILRPQELDRSMYHEYMEPNYKLGIPKNFNTVYFSHLYSTVAALAEIAKAHPALRMEILDALHHALDGDEYIHAITSEPPDASLYKEALGIRTLVHTI